MYANGKSAYIFSLFFKTGMYAKGDLHACYNGNKAADMYAIGLTAYIKVKKQMQGMHAIKTT